MPTGLVKSMSHAPGAARRRASSAISSTSGTVRSALASPPAPVVSCPTQQKSSGHVSSLSRAACPPTRSCISTAAAPSTPSSGVGGPPDGRPVPVRPHDPRGHGPDRGQPRLVGVDQDQLGDLRREPPEPVRELGRVSRPAADNSELQPERPHFARRTGRRGTPPRRCRAAAAGRDACAQVSTATGQRGWNRQPGRGSITLGGSPRSPAAAASASRLGGGALGSGTAESSSWVYGCRGRGEHVLDRPGLRDLPRVHHDQPVRDVPGAGDVVGDVEDRDVLLVAQLRHQVKQADPDRGVEHGDRLVGEDQPRPGRQRLGEADPLPLPAAQLVREAAPACPRRARPRRRPAPPRPAARRRTARGGAA